MLHILFVCLYFFVSEASILSSLGEIGDLHNASSPRCLAIKLSSKHLLTTQLCVANMHKTSRFYHSQIESTDTIIASIKFNKYYTVGGLNNIAIVITSRKLTDIENGMILQSFVEPGEYKVAYIGDETVVTVLDNKKCDEKQFTSNSYHYFDANREICAVIRKDKHKLSDHTIASGAVLLSPNKDKFIGLLSLADAPNEGPEQMLVFTRLPTYCNYLTTETEHTFKCSFS